MPPYRDNCRERADACKEIFDRFNISASREDFRDLVASWSRLLLAMDACGPYVGPPTLTGGKMPVAMAVGL